MQGRRSRAKLFQVRRCPQGLLALPTEILLLIIAELDWDDILRLRIVRQIDYLTSNAILTRLLDMQGSPPTHVFQGRVDGTFPTLSQGLDAYPVHPSEATVRMLVG